MEEKKDVFKENSKKNFNSTAKFYDESNDGKFVAPMYDEIIIRVNSLKPKKLLDVGCGTGNVLMKLIKSNNIELYGLDISEEMIKVAKNNLGNRAELKIADSESMPWEDNKFDVIVCNASFHHYPNPRKVLLEMRRVLKSDGSLIIGDPTAPIIVRQLLNLFCKKGNNGDYRIYSRNEINRLLDETGFKMLNFKKMNYKSFALNAKIK